MRHVVALAVFVAACVAGAFVFDVSEDGMRGYRFLCGLVFFPIAAAVWAFLQQGRRDPHAPREHADDVAARANDDAQRAALASALPAGVTWEFAPHRPGRCNHPETSPDHLVPD